MSYSSEVYIYLQTVKNFLNNSEEAWNYFLFNSDEELFYEHLCEIAQKNFEEKGVATLDQNQFELLRKTIMAIVISKKEISEKPQTEETTTSPFIDIPGIGKICLN
ncbi:hypothetical protein [Flavobacterium sp.]|uniref:hypothetical protein n=1 Tax=Flavobacterium sp. TaxID=239 RepID=UPI0038D1B052